MYVPTMYLPEVKALTRLWMLKNDTAHLYELHCYSLLYPSVYYFQFQAVEKHIPPYIFEQFRSQYAA